MSISTRMTWREVLSGLYIPDPTDNFGGAFAMSHPLLDILWPYGTSANQFDRFWCDVGRTIASNTNDDLDLNALAAAASPSGAAVSLAEVRAILLYWRSANTTNATLQPGASNGWTALGASFLKTIKPGTYERMICGVDGAYPVGGSDKVLRIANSTGATATYDILIVGTST
jgi:hypothetical protein